MSRPGKRGRLNDISAGDYAVQINAPLDDRFVKITDIRAGNSCFEHKHLKTKQMGIVRKEYIRKCSKHEELELKVIHDL